MRCLEKTFDRYGRFVSRNPYPFLVCFFWLNVLILQIIPCIVTILSSFGVLNFHSQDDIWDIYAPRNALSRDEEKALEKFEHMSSVNHYRIQVLVDRKDGQSLMNQEDIQEISIINNFIVNNVSTTDPVSGQKFLYRQMCGIFCNESNALILGFIQVKKSVNLNRLFRHIWIPPLTVKPHQI